MSGYSDLGYTYAYPNIARISYTAAPGSCCSRRAISRCRTRRRLIRSSADAAANRTSLFVIDLADRRQDRADHHEHGAAAPPSDLWSLDGCRVRSQFRLGRRHRGRRRSRRQPAGASTSRAARPASPRRIRRRRAMVCGDGSAASSSRWKVDLMFKCYGTNRATSAACRSRSCRSACAIARRTSRCGCSAPASSWASATARHRSPPAGCGADANTATPSIYGVRDYGNGPRLRPGSLSVLARAAELVDDRIETSTGHAHADARTSRSAQNRGWKIPLDVTQPSPASASSSRRCRSTSRTSRSCRR